MKRFEWLDELVKKEDFILGAEIGLRKGRTISFLLQHNSELTMYGVDLWGKAKDNKIDKYSEWDMTRMRGICMARLSKFGSRAVVYEEDSVKASHRILDGFLDFVFIDGDHTEQGVERDIDAWLPNVRDGGILAGHDLHFPSVKSVVDRKFDNYRTAPDNVWWIRVGG